MTDGVDDANVLGTSKVSSGGSVDNWKYVCHCVRVVFEVLYEARWIGSGKTIQEARNILAKGFSAHPVVANVLNVHMQKRLMMREEHNKIQSGTKKLIVSCREEVRKDSIEVG